VSKKQKPAEIIAKSLLELLETYHYEEDLPRDIPVLLGIGGGHYAPRFTDVILEKKAAFGHMIPRYHIDSGNINDEMLEKALQATPNDFIFSDTKDMKIKDPAVLESFGMSYKKGGYTPAKISKKYNLNNPDIQKTLNDPTADIIARSTAKRMYDKNLSQLGKLALVQEARKGFPQGPPSISMPYMQKVGMDPSMFMPDVMTPQDAQVSMGKAQKGGGFWSDDYYKAALEQESQNQEEEKKYLPNYY